MRVVLIGFATVAISFAALLAYAALRPNRAEVDARLDLESWDIVTGGEHHSNTDLISWHGDLLLVHASSPWHLGSTQSRLVIRRSRNGRDFETLATLRVPGHDIRDPKLAIIGDRLHLYALPNSGLYATPEITVLSTSADGVTWTPFEPVGPPGWLFWRPKTRDGLTWYVPAYWHEHGRSILLRTENGRDFRQVSVIHEGDGNDETAIEFLPDGRILATARLEVTPDALLGNAGAATLLAVAEPPYESWTTRRSTVTRLDGPLLFRIDGTIFAVARHQPGSRGPLTRLGSSLSRKRTSLYRVEPDRLVWLSDLPSAGDTSYAGLVERPGEILVDYYTSRTDRDYPWLLGMFMPTDIRMARIPIPALLAVSAAHP